MIVTTYRLTKIGVDLLTGAWRFHRRALIGTVLAIVAVGYVGDHWNRSGTWVTYLPPRLRPTPASSARTTATRSTARAIGEEPTDHYILWPVGRHHHILWDP